MKETEDRGEVRANFDRAREGKETVAERALAASLV